MAKKEEGKSTETILPSQSTSRVTPWYAPNEKNKTQYKHKLLPDWEASSPEHFNTERTIRWLTWSSVLYLYSLLQTQLREILVKQPEVTLKAHRSLEKETQRHRGVQSAEQRWNLSSKMSGLFLPVALSAVRVVPLADGGGNCSSILVPLRWCLCVSCGRCS